MSNIKNMIGATLIALGAFVFWGWLLPGYNSFSLLRSDIETKQVDVVKKKTIVDNLNGLITKYDSRADEIDRLSLLVPPSKNLSEIITAIESLSSTTGLQLSSVKLGAQKNTAGETSSVVSIELSMLGEYIPFTGFLDQLEKNIRLMDIISISIGQSTDAAFPDLLNIVLKINTYFLDDTN